MREYKICIMGGGGVGKSSITVRFVHSWFVEKYDPTIEDSYRKVVTVDGITCAVEIIDTAGTEQFVSLHSLYVSSGDGFVLVFSLTSLESVNEVQTIRDQIHRLKEAETGRRVPIVLVGNKCDLVAERQVSRSVAINLSKSWNGVPYFESSARKGVNIQELFDDVVRQMIKSGAMRGSQTGSGRGERKKKGMRCVIL